MNQNKNITANHYRLNAFAQLIKQYKIYTLVEVGVRDGFFSKDLMEYTTANVIGIDINHSAGIRELLDKYHPRYKFIQGRSPAIAYLFSDNSLDCVYLDNCHHYEHIASELPIWYKKVKVGGILSGHDFMEYYCEADGEGQFGIMEAVIKFTEKHDIQFYVTGCSHITVDKMRDYGIDQGNELVKYSKGEPHHHFDVPSWYLFKERII